MNESQTINIQILELDMTRSGNASCEACDTVKNHVGQIAAEIRPLLMQVNTEIKIEKVLVQSLEQAEELHFKASPTIRIGELEIIPTKGDITGYGERYWEWQGKYDSIPPTGLVIDRILHAYIGNQEKTTPEVSSFEPPDVLRAFFTDEPKDSIKGSCC